MKKQTVTLAICTALLLAACGGDKDKDDRLPADPGRSRIDDRQYDQRQAYHGTAYTVASSRSRTDNRDLEALNGDDLGTLRIDGKTLPARQVGIYVGGLPKLKTQGATVEGISYKNYLISGDDYKNSRFGYITHGGIDYVFSQGAFTQNMPTSGSARYEGDAAVGRDGITTAADADFNVNFSNRTVSGRISPERDSAIRFDPVNIDARISGNAFYSEGKNVSTSGHFYGKNAREMGGVKDGPWLAQALHAYWQGA